MTTGIFAGIAARAAEEMAAEGKKEITPYWRTLKVGGALNEKYPGGVAAQARLLESEGHTIISDKNGSPKKVREFEKVLIEI
jgi:alkylated DNA nucleotide flippase Atl1